MLGPIVNHPELMTEKLFTKIGLFLWFSALGVTFTQLECCIHRLVFHQYKLMLLKSMLLLKHFINTSNNSFSFTAVKLN